MNRVKVKVILTNSLDESLVDRGLIAPEEIRRCETEAVVERALLHTTIPRDVLQKLGLEIGRKQVMQGNDRSKQLAEFTDPVTIELGDRTATVETLVTGDEVAIGRISLEWLDIVVEESNRRLIPNPAHPHNPVYRI